MRILALVLTGFLLSPVFAHDIVPAKKPEKPILIRGAVLHTASVLGTIRGDLLIVDGRIEKIDTTIDPPAGATVIKANGRHVYPGMVAAATAMGLGEINAVRSTKDDREVGEFNPAVKAQIAFNADSEHLPVNRSNGLTHAHVIPTGGILSGQGSLMRLDGWNWEDCTHTASTGMSVQWPAGGGKKGKKKKGEGGPESPKTAEAVVRRLDRYITDARAYHKARKADPSRPVDQNLQALGPILDGERPVFLFANRKVQIEESVAWARRHGFKAVIVGGDEAEDCAELLKEAGVPVIITMTHRLPARRDSAWNDPYTLPARLHRKGVTYCIAPNVSVFGVFRARSLADDAGTARAFGLPDDEALKAITRYPAEILGARDIGSLEVGHEASLIVTNGDFLETMTRVERAFIRGREIDLSNKQTRLVDKYSRKLERD